MATATAPSMELSVRAPADSVKATPTPLEAAGFTAQQVFIAGLMGLGVAALVVGLSLGFALPRPTTTNTNTLTVSTNVTVVPEWAVFPAEVGAKWSYDTTASIGPQHWGMITKNSSTKELLYPVCAQTSQSPIDIVTSTSTTPSTPNYLPERFYNATSFTIVPRPGGHPGFQLTPNNGTAVWKVDGVSYNLLQFHYHSPSEHTVDGVRYPLEVHFVHQNPLNGALAVFGILFPYSEEGVKANPFIAKWWDYIFSEEDHKVPYAVDFSKMIDDVTPTSPLFRYSGSLTTPPCSESVSWHVSVSKEGVSKAQVYAYKLALETINNFRPIQALNGRIVTKQTPVLPSTWA